MRILLLSDIHANWAALRTIQEPYDICLFLGDLVEYGLNPVPCIDWAMKNAHYAVRGNHDHGCAQAVEFTANAGFRYLTTLTRPLNAQQLTEKHRRYLATLPTTRWVTIAGKTFLLVHANPHDPMDEYAPADVDFWKKRLEGIDADYVCVGHTHMQYTLRVGRTTIVNPGSVGLPRDGDPRGGYAIMTPDEIIHRRFEYPIEEAIACVEQSSLNPTAKQMLSDVYRTGRLVRRIESANGTPDSHITGAEHE
ncbi:MAG: metallophosphoesterase family protein [Zavarzinella sp.]